MPIFRQTLDKAVKTGYNHAVSLGKRRLTLSFQCLRQWPQRRNDPLSPSHIGNWIPTAFQVSNSGMIGQVYNRAYGGKTEETGNSTVWNGMDCAIPHYDSLVGSHKGNKSIRREVFDSLPIY